MILSMVWGVEWAVEKGDFPPIVVLAVGVSLGGLIQCLVQFPLLLAKGMVPTFKCRYSREVGIIFGKLGPGFLGFAGTQLNLLVTTVLATSSGVGAVSWLSFAFRLFQFPLGILGVSVANSNMVLFSEQWRGGDREKAVGILKSALRLVVFLLLPSGACLWVLALPVVKLIFERGAFSPRTPGRPPRL